VWEARGKLWEAKKKTSYFLSKDVSWLLFFPIAALAVRNHPSKVLAYQN
tara:strand:- start:339 stop:485 length:147 start_codon:yes stop_codon:yes gene_type:complete